MSDPWPMIAGIGAGIAAAAAVGQMIVAGVALGQQNSSETETQRELAELKQRLEKLQQTLREHGYLNDGGVSMESARAKAQVQRIHTIDDFRKMEQSLEERVKALTSRPNGPAEKARSTKMMEELGRRFLYE